MKLRILFSSLIILLVANNGISKTRSEHISWGQYFSHSLKGAGVGFLVGTAIAAGGIQNNSSGDFGDLGYLKYVSYGTIIGSSIGTAFIAQNQFYTPMATSLVQLVPAILLFHGGRVDLTFYLGLSSIFITPTLALLFDKVPPNPPLKPKQNKRKVTVLPMVEPIRKSYGLSINIRF